MVSGAFPKNQYEISLDYGIQSIPIHEEGQTDQKPSQPEKEPRLLKRKINHGLAKSELAQEKKTVVTCRNWNLFDYPMRAEADSPRFLFFAWYIW